MGSLTSRVVTRISSRPSGASALVTRDGFSSDFGIAGLDFLSGASKERPYVRKTAEYRKDQIDQTPIPGEQSMVFWWLRSQISFHGGTGILFEEPALDPGILYSDPLAAVSIPVRYQDSEGVDPFTQPGHVTLLPTTTLNQADVGSIILEGAQDASGVDMYLQATSSTLRRVVAGSSATVTWGGAATILSMTNDGTNYYVADSVGIWKGTLAGGAGAKAWNTGSSAVVIKWVKDRLMAAIGLSLYELVGGSPPTLPTALYTAQKPNYVWSAIEDGPDGIYLAGHDGNVSDIWFVGLTTGVGNTPVLSPPKKISELPRGEIIYCLKQVLGSFLAIGTNKGIRIAQFDSAGRVNYGPLFCTLPTGASPVYSIDAYDRFVLGAWGNGMADGTSGLVKIDLGFQTQFQHFAYCKDLRSHVTGTVRSVTQLGSTGRMVFAVDGHGSYLQSSSTLEPNGYLQTGNIRFHTQEAKLYKLVKLQIATTYGSVSASMSTSTGGNSSIGTLSSGSTGGELGLPYLSPMDWANLTFTLARDGVDSTKGPTFNSYQLKALPAQKNQRNILVPILLFDHETDKFGNKRGYEGFAMDRLAALEELEEARDELMFQDFSRVPFGNRLVVIDDINFQQTDPPTNAEGLGGYAYVTLRTVT
jgi:hypothetical protein